MASLHSAPLLRPPPRSIDLVRSTVRLLLALSLHPSVLYLACFISFPLPLSSIAPPLFTLLITPSFYLPDCHSFFSSSSTYSTMGDLSQAFKTDGWWWMARLTTSLPLCRSLFVFLPFFSHGLDFVFFDALLKLMRMRLRERDDVLSND